MGLESLDRKAGGEAARVACAGQHHTHGRVAKAQLGLGFGRRIADGGQVRTSFGHSRFS